MTDLVRGDLEDELAHECLFDLRRESAAGFQDIDPEGGLLGEAIRVIAPGARLTAPPGRQQRFGLLRRWQREDRGDELFAQASDRADDAFAEPDVGIVNLPVKGIGAGRADGEAGIHPGKPADGVIASVGGVPVRIVGHLLYDDGIFETDLFEGLVPQQDPFRHPLAVFEGDSVFEPENDGLFWGGE